jgi:hypothetical protein
MLVNEPHQVAFGNVVFQLELVEQRFGTGMLPHHDQQASGNENQAAHGRNASLYRALPADHSDFFNTHA